MQGVFGPVRRVAPNEFLQEVGRGKNSSSRAPTEARRAALEGISRRDLAEGSRIVGVLGLLAGLVLGLCQAAAAEALPPLGITLDATSVSGLSAGAYMAGQIELAHSKDAVGVGVVTGGPFACAETGSSRLFPYWPVVLWRNASQAANECVQAGRPA
jgi:hypothetical protein